MAGNWHREKISNDRNWGQLFRCMVLSQYIIEPLTV